MFSPVSIFRFRRPLNTPGLQLLHSYMGTCPCKSAPSMQPVHVTPPSYTDNRATTAHPLCTMHLDTGLRPPAATVHAGAASSVKLLPATVCTCGPRLHCLIPGESLHSHTMAHDVQALMTLCSSHHRQAQR